MKKPHGNTGKRNALKSGRTKTMGLRMTQQVHDYLKSGESSAADEIERLVIAEIGRNDQLNKEHEQ